MERKTYLAKKGKFMGMKCIFLFFYVSAKLRRSAEALRTPPHRFAFEQELLKISF
jgi:hypothetical protein